MFGLRLLLFLAPGEGGGGGGGNLAGAGPAVEALGSLRTFDEGTAAKEFAEGLNRTVAGIRELGKDAAKISERVDRALPTLEAKFADAKRSERAEWVPGGTHADLMARYANADGSIRLGATTETIEFPEIGGVTVKRQGLLTERPVTVAHARVQEAYAGFGLAFKRAKLRTDIRTPWADDLVQRGFTAFRRSLEELPAEAGRYFRSYFAPGWAARAINSTATTGGELIVNPQLTTLRRPADLERRIPGLIPMKEAPAPDFRPITITGRAIPYLRGTTGDDPAVFQGSNFTSAIGSVSVVNRVALAKVDPIWAVDAAKILGDAMGFVRQWIDEGDLLALEAAFIHGDSTATHEDTLTTWTLNALYSAGQLSGSGSPLRFWKGFRRLAVDASAVATGGGTWDITDHTAALALMGNHERKAIIITGLHCLLTQLVGNSNFLTWDKAGPYASLLTGTVGIPTVAAAGTIAGKPLYISETMGKQFDTTSGLYTGSNLGNEMVYVNPEAFDQYDLAAGAEDIDENRAEKGIHYLGVVRRTVLVKNTVAGEVPAAYVYNL